MSVPQATLLALGLVLVPASLSRAGEAVATTPRFAFHSDFATNLNDALLEAGRARIKNRPELFRSGAQQVCFDELAPSARVAWNHAVAYYAEIVSSGSWSDRVQVLIRHDLSGLEAVEGDRDRRLVGIVRGIMQAAAPAYEACRWPEQDAENKSWIAALVEQLALHGDAIARRLGQVYGTPLAGLPIRVDVVETVNWSGATTWLLDPAGGHILISKAEPGAASLELVFHEASHTLMRRGNPLPAALAQGAGRLGVELPRDLWHAVLFYTTGETVRRTLVEAGEPDYTPMMITGKIFDRFRAPLQAVWSAYLDGQSTLDRAAADLLRELERTGRGS